VDTVCFYTTLLAPATRHQFKIRFRLSSDELPSG